MFPFLELLTVQKETFSYQFYWLYIIRATHTHTHNTPIYDQNRKIVNVIF